jgi:chromosome segregation ATPase
MPTISKKHRFSGLSNDELKEEEQNLRSEIRRLGTAIEEEREERDRLKERLRKGDTSVQDQLDDVNETINDLQGERSTKRARLQKARSIRQSSGRGASASKPSYSA